MSFLLCSCRGNPASRRMSNGNSSAFTMLFSSCIGINWRLGLICSWGRGTDDCYRSARIAGRAGDRRWRRWVLRSGRGGLKTFWLSCSFISCSSWNTLWCLSVQEREITWKSPRRSSNTGCSHTPTVLFGCFRASPHRCWPSVLLSSICLCFFPSPFRIRRPISRYTLASSMNLHFLRGVGGRWQQSNLCYFWGRWGKEPLQGGPWLFLTVLLFWTDVSTACSAVFWRYTGAVCKIRPNHSNSKSYS